MKLDALIKKRSAIFSFIAWIRLLLAIMLIAVVVGSSVAFFLWALDEVIQIRFRQPYLLFFLPVAGLLIYFLYQRAGKSIEQGNNLIIDETYELRQGVPKRMAPMILFTTLITHLFGGSAGREGTAVQMGGSIAHAIGNCLQVEHRTALTAGVAAGFAAVFGTPIAGAIFAIEVLRIGKINYRGFLPALVAAFIADSTVAAWQVAHTTYVIDFTSTGTALLASDLLYVDGLLLVKAALAAVAFGGASWLFAYLTRKIKSFTKSKIRQRWLIPMLGGVTIILLTLVNGKPDYLSLGVNPEYPTAVTLQSAFSQGGADTWSWLWKSIYTAVTIGTGFKGGEVTPLFYIGATLGNVLSELLQAPVSLFAALGFIAVFSGATNTPLACTLMGAELFGAKYLLFYALVCFLAYYFSGSKGIYTAQR